MQPPEKRGYQISLVIRRVGGLEAFLPLARQIRSVTRRVGGLEVIYPKNKKDTLTDKETSILRELVKELAHG